MSVSVFGISKRMTLALEGMQWAFFEKDMVLCSCRERCIVALAAVFEARSTGQSASLGQHAVTRNGTFRLASTLWYAPSCP